MSEPRLSKTANRSVLGVMNRLSSSSTTSGENPMVVERNRETLIACRALATSSLQCHKRGTSIAQPVPVQVTRTR